MSGPISPRGHLDARMTELQNLLLEMAGRAEELVGIAMEGLLRRRLSGAAVAQAADDRVDELEVAINARAAEFLALQHPVATDLRFAIVVLMACRNIERIGDHAVNIAGAGQRAAGHAPLPEIQEIREIGDLVRRMLSRALGALVNRDGATARGVIADDRVVDALRQSAIGIIVSYMHEQPRYIAPGVNLILVAQNLERIGDLAANIAEEVVFLVEGRSIKHTGKARSS